MIGKSRISAVRRLNAAQDLNPAAARHLKSAWELLGKGRVEDAEQILACAIALAPDHACVTRIQGEIFLLQGRDSEAASTLSDYVQRDSRDVSAQLSLARALENCGQHESAFAVLRRVCELMPTDESWFLLGLLCDRYANHEQALGAARECLAINPHHAGAAFLKARSLQALGDIPGAVVQYRALLGRNVDAPKAWFGLVDLKTIRLTATEIAQLAKQYSLAQPGRPDSILLGFALGRVLEQSEDYKGAFETFQTVNSAVRRGLAWNSHAHSKQVTAIRSAFPFPAEEAGDPEFGNSVIFVVGLPRSGSTLVEQVLAAHSRIEGASELPHLADVLAEESRRRRLEYPLWVESATPADWARMGSEYLRRTSRWRQERPMSTDKSLENWKHVGAIRKMLPGARIIDCRRDPVETAWSCYKQYFAPACAEFSYDFGDLARYWSDYDQLMSHWEHWGRRRYRTQSLELLLENPQSEIESLIDFVGIPFEESCREPQLATRGVRTASAAQVREPLARSVSLADRYGDLLNPLRDGLSPPPEGAVSAMQLQPGNR